MNAHFDPLIYLHPLQNGLADAWELTAELCGGIDQVLEILQQDSAINAVATDCIMSARAGGELILLPRIERTEMHVLPVWGFVTANGRISASIPQPR